MAIEIQAPNPRPEGKYTIFLAGVIDQGTAKDWQKEIVEALADYDVALLNPRRDDWDSSWEQDADDPQFREQVEWEQKGMEESDFRVFVMLDDSKAPITLMELGQHAEDPGAVCCEDEFYRKGNVDIVCEEAKMPVFVTLDEMIAYVKVLLDEMGLKGHPATEPAAEPGGEPAAEPDAEPAAEPDAKTSAFFQLEEVRAQGRKGIAERNNATCRCGHGGEQHELFGEENCMESSCECPRFNKQASKTAATSPMPSAPEGFQPWYGGMSKEDWQSLEAPMSTLDPLDDPDFAAWFEGSQVADGTGRPLVAFHGTSSESKKFVERGKGEWAQLGFWFDTNPRFAHKYMGGDIPRDTPNMIAVYLRVTNPKVIDTIDDLRDIVNGMYGPTFKARCQKYRKDLKKAGFDGIRIENSMADGYTSFWVCFDPHQIRSAYGKSQPIQAKKAKLLIRQGGAR